MNENEKPRLRIVEGSKPKEELAIPEQIDPPKEDAVSYTEKLKVILHVDKRNDTPEDELISLRDNLGQLAESKHSFQKRAVGFLLLTGRDHYLEGLPEGSQGVQYLYSVLESFRGMYGDALNTQSKLHVGKPKEDTPSIKSHLAFDELPRAELEVINSLLQQDVINVLTAPNPAQSELAPLREQFVLNYESLLGRSRQLLERQQELANSAQSLLEQVKSSPSNPDVVSESERISEISQKLLGFSQKLVSSIENPSIVIADLLQGELVDVNELTSSYQAFIMLQQQETTISQMQQSTQIAFQKLITNQPNLKKIEHFAQPDSI